MAEQRAIIDFRSAGDTGVDDSESVQPVKNVEFADEVVFGRPVENLRRRTERLRGVTQDLLHYRDYGDLIIELTSGGSIAWGGPTSSGGTGVVTVTGTIKVSPRAAPATPVRGFLSVGTASSNQITYAVGTSGYATHGLNGITVEHRSGSGQALSVNVTPGPQKHLIVFFDAANAAHTTSAVKNIVDSAIAADGLLAGKLFTTVSGAGVIAPIAETPLSASADDESHWIAGALITTLTTTRKLNVGDGVGIWYKHTIEPTTDPVDPKGNVAGGRAESSVTRGNHNIPAGSLFITSDDVRKIPGAIVLFRIGYGGQLILLDGTRIAAGETNTLSSVNAQIVAKGYATEAYANNAAASAANAAVSNRATTQYVDTAVANGIATRTTPTTVDQKITAAFQAYQPPPSGTSSSEVNSLINTHYTNTSVPQRDQAIANALAAAQAGGPRAFTAIFGTAGSGADHNGGNANALFDATYPVPSIFYVRQGVYTVSTNTTTSAGRTVFGEGVTFTLAASTTVPIILSGTYQNCSFATQGTGRFRAEGTVTLRNCEIYANAFDVAEGASLILDNCRFIGSRLQADGTTMATLPVPPNVSVHARNCQFVAPTIPGSGAFAIISIYIAGPCTATSNVTFENCKIETSDGNMHTAACVWGSNDATLFRSVKFSNCSLRNDGQRTTGYGVVLERVWNVAFDNCRIYARRSTPLHTVASGARFTKCTFSSSDDANAGAVPPFIKVWPYTFSHASGLAGYIDMAPPSTQIIDCEANVGAAHTVGGPTDVGLFVFGDERAAKNPPVWHNNGVTGSDVYESHIHVSGLHIRFKSSVVALPRCPIVMLVGNCASRATPNLYENISLDVNGCYWEGEATYNPHPFLHLSEVMVFGYLTGGGNANERTYNSVRVKGLSIVNVSRPSANVNQGVLSTLHAEVEDIVIAPVTSTLTGVFTAPLATLKYSHIRNLVINDAGRLPVVTAHAVWIGGDLYRQTRVDGGALYGTFVTNTMEMVGLESYATLSNFIIKEEGDGQTNTRPLVLMAGWYDTLHNCFISKYPTASGDSQTIVSAETARFPTLLGCTFTARTYTQAAVKLNQAANRNETIFLANRIVATGGGYVDAYYVPSTGNAVDETDVDGHYLNVFRVQDFP